jgi:hypothetical protein
MAESETNEPSSQNTVVSDPQRNVVTAAADGPLEQSFHVRWSALAPEAGDASTKIPVQTQ